MASSTRETREEGARPLSLGRHTKVNQDPRDIPHQDCQLSSLSDTRHLSLIQSLSELDELCHLLLIVPGVEAPGLSLR
jgi:hypothetical protein